MIYLTLYILANFVLFLKIKDKVIEMAYNDPEHYFMEDFVYSLSILIVLSLGSVLFAIAMAIKLKRWLIK